MCSERTDQHSKGHQEDLTQTANDGTSDMLATASDKHRGTAALSTSATWLDHSGQADLGVC